MYGKFYNNIFHTKINSRLYEKRYGASVENAVNADLGEFPWVVRVGRIEDGVNM